MSAGPSSRMIVPKVSLEMGSFWLVGYHDDCIFTHQFSFHLSFDQFKI